MARKRKSLSLTDKLFYDQHSKYVDISSGGSATFKGTNLSVFYVGSLLTFGEYKTNILSEYPSLNPDDLKFAKMYHAMESLKEVEKLAPDFNSTEAAIDRFKAAEKRTNKDE